MDMKAKETQQIINVIFIQTLEMYRIQRECDKASEEILY